MPRSRNCVIAATVAWVCLALTGCGDPGDPDLFQKAEDLYRAGRFEEAIPVLKSFLLRHPSHSGAHLYLGGCYQFSEQWSALAEGEIKTALLYFHENGNRSTIARFDDAYFELRCYLDLIKIQFARLDFALGPKAPPQILAPVLQDFKHSIAEALRIAPENPEVKSIAETAKQIVRVAEAVQLRRMGGPVRNER